MVAIDSAKLRAWWFHRQGLDGYLAGLTAAEALQRAGWARSVGGSGPYLSLCARVGLSRDAIDAAVQKLEIHELPSARGCTYVLPVADYALALKLSEEFSGNEMKVATKLGVTGKEIDKLCNAVLGALDAGPLDPEEIRSAIGKAARSLGEEGKKKGLTTTLPIALGRLQVLGEIRRVPTNGRLDQQRYRYVRWKPNPLAKSKLSREEAHVELAKRYFRWIGPATLSEFQWFSGLGVKAAKAAIETLCLVAMQPQSDRVMFADDHDALLAFAGPRKSSYAMVSSLDSMFLLRRDLSQLLTPEAARQTVYAEKGCAVLGGLSDLPSNAILDCGSVVGLWEFDPATGSIAAQAFGRVDHALKELIARMEAYIREQLGDARSFSLDSPKSRVPRLEALRKAASQDTIR